MPNLTKIKKKSKKKVPKPTKKSNLPTSLKPTKKSPSEYYQCLLTSAHQNWLDPTTGKKKKITACCKDCKTNASVLNKPREQEIKKLITSYQQVGECLKKLLKPIK